MPVEVRQAMRKIVSNHDIFGHPDGVPRGANDKFAVIALYRFLSIEDDITGSYRPSASIQWCPALARPSVPILIVMSIQTNSSPTPRKVQSFERLCLKLPGDGDLTTYNCESTRCVHVCVCVCVCSKMCKLCVH